MKTVELHIELSDIQAYEYAQFLKRVCFSDYRSHAQTENEAYVMVHAGERIRAALEAQGYAPR